MARPLRLEYPGALYHVTSRGDGKEDIYFCDNDRWQFLDILGRACDRHNWICHAYCLMTNHYHLLIETPDANLSVGMRLLNGVYTQSINREHDRVGHLFQGRFKAILVDKESYLLELSRYIILNPVRAQMVNNPEEWFWSSFRAMIGLANKYPWLHIDGLLLLFGKRRRLAIARYQQFVLDGVYKSSPWENLNGQIFLGSDAFMEKLKTRIHDSNLSEIPQEQRRRAPKSLPAYVDEYKNLDLAMLHAYYSGGYKQREIAKYFGVHYTTVSRAIKRAEDR